MGMLLRYHRESFVEVTGTEDVAPAPKVKEEQPVVREDEQVKDSEKKQRKKRSE